ncbi:MULTISPECIES: TetR/AcrR family transcriptional regulator [unclassified Nocardia]|uniref:TetR/AcrR family transcriptional regulator n=1 Tax=unclassified Nocardia TaxID=2637762 RepID=UPI0033A7717A
MASTTRSSDALRAAALALIAESGLDSLTLLAVAERAGVSRATAYREFGDKDGLVAAVGRGEIAAMVAAAYGAIDLFAPLPEVVRSATLFALAYLRKHPAFGYIRSNEPGWLLGVAVQHGDAELNLVEMVAALAAPLIAARAGDGLALPPAAAAEVVVRIVLSHALIEHSALTDEQIADTATRAVVAGSA